MKKWRFCLLIFLIVLLWEVLPVASAENGKIAFTSFRHGNGEIYVMNADGTGQTRLTFNLPYNGEPAWSPNGSKIAFTSYRYGNSDIYVMNRDGTGQTRLTNYTAYDREPAWSPDGSKIVFVSYRDGNDEIYLMNADGTEQTRLTNYTAYDREPAWSPDGSKIAFGSWRNGNSDICIMNPDGIGQTYLTSNTVYDGEPAWSPDGSKISFTSNRDGNNQIYLMNPDGSGQTRITTNTENDYHPVWSTDGLKIAFVSSRDGNGEIYTMNPDGTEQTRVTYNTVYDDQPDWTTLEQIVLIANFSATPISGTAPLTVSFTDLSTNSSTGWAWFFGDENFTAPWSQVNASAGWSARYSHTSVVMADGSIVLMGGIDGWLIWKNDVWRSADNGATWTQMNTSAGWSARYGHTSVVMADGSIVLMGGIDGRVDYKNDTWRSTDNGATWTQMNTSAGWSARGGHTSVVVADGSIVLMGGVDFRGYKDDVWRSTDNGATWTQVNASAGWSARCAHTSVVMADGSIVLMGGFNSRHKNDVWRSTDNGITWTQVNASAEWTGRLGHTSVVMADGSIVLIGGVDYGGNKDDVWRSMDNGITWTQVNASAGWTPRNDHGSVAMPDGSIVLTGGSDGGYRNDVWRYMPAGSSAQNPSHTYNTPGIYPVSLQVYNAGGYNSTRKAGYITVYHDRGDGGSDSGDNTPSSTILTDTTITETVNVGGGSAITQAEVTGTNLGRNLVITAFPRDSLPSGIAVPNTTVYQYISITSSTIPGVVSQATFDFSVPQSWLSEHGFTAGDIVMMHNENGEWQTLDTRYVSQNGGNVFYRATTPGFSYFAIVYQKGGTDMGTGTPVPTTLPTTVATAEATITDAPSPVAITTEKTQIVPPAPVADPVKGIPLTAIIIGVIGVIAIITGAFLVRRWWIRRQNPALFREYD